MGVTCHGLSSALMGGEDLAFCSGRFSSGKESPTPVVIGGCGGLKLGVDSGERKNFCSYRISNTILPSPSLLTAVSSQDCCSVNAGSRGYSGLSVKLCRLRDLEWVFVFSLLWIWILRSEGWGWTFRIHILLPFSWRSKLKERVSYATPCIEFQIWKPSESRKFWPTPDVMNIY